MPDPADPARIYVATFGGGVWHGPATGDPTSTEDVVGLAAGVAARQPLPTAVAPDAGDRLGRLVEANIVGVHAYQVLLARRQSKGDLRATARQASPTVNWRRWSTIRPRCWVGCGGGEGVGGGQTSPFDPAKDLDPCSGAG